MMKKMLVLVMMGSVCFGNISAAAGPAARVGQQKVMAFDFDQTFIPGHTNGWPYNQNRVTKKAALNVLSDPHYREYLQKLQGLGFKIVVVTRGIEADVARALNEAGLSDIIAPQDVYGALVSPHDTYSNGHEQSGRPARIGINTPKEWESKKVEYLNYIMTQYHTTKDNVYFYDDTPNNVKAAQDGGFPHSYVVDWKNGANGVNLLKAIVAEQESIIAEQEMRSVNPPAKKRKKMNAMTPANAKRMGEKLRQQQDAMELEEQGEEVMNGRHLVHDSEGDDMYGTFTSY